MFPVPKDVRAVRDLELLKGQDELIRNDWLVVDEAARFDPGEWVKPETSGGITKAAKLAGGDDLTTPALGARMNWTLRVPDGDGQTDTLATKAITVLSGTYEAKTSFYNTSGTFTPGFLVVAVYDSVNARGYLDAPDPSAMTARQLQAVVGRVVELASGRLQFSAPGL